MAIKGLIKLKKRTEKLPINSDSILFHYVVDLLPPAFDAMVGVYMSD